MSSAFLLVIGNREGLSWILGSRRMAFVNASALGALVPEDQLFLYTTRGCFRNPSRHLSRVIGRATVTSDVTMLPEPLTLADRSFCCGCAINIDSLAPFGKGVELRNYVNQLAVFSENPQAWSIRIRRTLLPLSDSDAGIIAAKLAAITKRPQEVIEPYLRWFPELPNN